MFTKLLSGVALAATFAVPQVASAGHGCCPSRGYHGPAAVQTQPAVTPHHTTASPGTDTAQPPVESGEGRVIRRFT